MKNKVTALFEDDADMSERLDALSVRAKTGEFSAIATIVVFADGAVGTMFKLGKDGNVFTLLGALEQVKTRMLEDGVA